MGATSQGEGIGTTSPVKVQALLHSEGAGATS